MNEQHSKWETSELVKTFLEGVRGAIPGASFQLEVLSKIVNMWCPLPYRILDLGCGDGILGRMLLDAHATAHVIFADISTPMLEATKKRSVTTHGQQSSRQILQHQTGLMGLRSKPLLMSLCLVLPSTTNLMIERKSCTPRFMGFCAKVGCF